MTRINIAFNNKECIQAVERCENKDSQVNNERWTSFRRVEQVASAQLFSSGLLDFKSAAILIVAAHVQCVLF